MLLRDMETVNALELRQSLGKVLDQLERGGEPILVCRRRTPAAVLVSLKDYLERFPRPGGRRSTTRSRGPVAATPVRVASRRNDARRAEKPALVIVVDGTTSARVMPYDRPGVLTDDEAYAVTAYLLPSEGHHLRGGRHGCSDQRNSC